MIPGSLPPDFWLRNATAPATLLDRPGPTDAEGLARLDLRITDGRIAALAPAGTAPEGIDLDRGQVWPCFVDGHVHLDKTQTWPRQPNPDGTHPGAKNAVIADRAQILLGSRYRTALRVWPALRLCPRHRSDPHASRQLLAGCQAPGRSFAGCETPGPAGSTCRRSASVRWNVLPAMTVSRWQTRWRDPAAYWA